MAKINSNAKILEKLSNNNHWRVRHNIAGNPNANQRILDKSNNDDDWEVRYAVAKNPNTNVKTSKYI